MANSRKTKFNKIKWPFDDETAKYVECYVANVARAKVYVWRDRRNRHPDWVYTISAGPNSERSHTGMTTTHDLEEAQERASNVARDSLY